MYAGRTLEDFIIEVDRQFPALLVIGPRQVGKTTILQHLSKDKRTYVTLDDPAMRELATQEPALFLQRFSPPVLIDEIQYAPELLSHIKIAIDSNRAAGMRAVGMFWLTGSQQFQLMKGVSESLAGRVGIVNLLGLSQFEMLGLAKEHTPFLPTEPILKKRQKDAHTARKLSESAGARAASEAAKTAALAVQAAIRDNKKSGQAIDKMLEAAVRAATYGQASKVGLRGTYERIWRGSFPAIALNDDMNRDIFYGSYVQTYLQRDVRDLANVGDEGGFLKFLRAAAARTGQLLNMSDMARDAAVSPTTAQRWLSVLEASSIIYLLESYHTNTTKRMIKAPKLYFLDTGLAAYLTEWSSPETLEAGAMSGAILETFVFTEILKSYWHNGRRAPLYYYRDKDKKEIDVLIVQDEKIYPLECKKTASPDRNTAKQFKVLEQLHKPIEHGGIICLSETLLPITDKINAIPVGLL
jgi:predicted AAA+ superfamily ATPase